MRRDRWLQIHENICTQWIYFYRNWGFQHNSFYDVKLTKSHCEDKNVSGTLVENRSEHDATVELTIGRVIWFFVCFPKEKKETIDRGML